MAFSTIEVVVNRNDTMDQLFRRFELNLADLATLRGLPELRSQLDRLKPGEMLRLHAPRWRTAWDSSASCRTAKR